MTKTVLIIDDAYFMRSLLKKALKEAGYEIIGEAKNGKEGIKLYFDLKPDFVTMDISMPDTSTTDTNMPNISGIHATKQILSKDPTAKIIAVTGNNDEDIKRQILEAGAKEYLQKPFQPAFLWSKIEKMLIETEELQIDVTPIAKQEDTPNQTAVVIAEGVEDNFEEMEIEIMDKPDESKSMTLVIENQEDSIEFPNEYNEIVKAEIEAFELTKEKLVVEEDEILIEFDNSQTLVEFEIEEQTPPTIEKPVATGNAYIQPVSHRTPEVRPSVPKTTQTTMDRSPVSSTPIPKEKFVSTVEISKGKTSNKNLGEINIRPQGTYSNSGGEVNILPPRGKILRESHDRLDNADIAEPILNVSDEDNYNNNKNNSFFGIFKKIFKK